MQDNSMEKEIVLYAEDEALQRMFLESELSKRYKVIAASDIQEAINEVDREKNIAIVLTDYDLGYKGNGLLLAKYIKSKTSIPVLLFTGDPKKAKEDVNFKYCNACLDKGLELQKLISFLNLFLE